MLEKQLFPGISSFIISTNSKVLYLPLQLTSSMDLIRAAMLITLASSIQGLPEGRGSTMTSISYVSGTTVCFDGELSPEDDIRLLYKNTNYVGVFDEQDSKCVKFDTGLKTIPLMNEEVEYVIGFTGDEEIFSGIDSVGFKFTRQMNQPGHEILECGSTSFVRTSSTSNCLNEEIHEWCYQLNIVCTSPFPEEHPQSYFQYCQRPSTPVDSVLTPVTKDKVETLEYEGGRINLTDPFHEVIEMIIVDRTFDQFPQVELVRNTKDPVLISDFEPSTKVYHVCSVFDNRTFSEETITDIDLKGQYINGYFEYSLTRTDSARGPFTVSVGRGDAAETELLKCDHVPYQEVFPEADRRCYGYIQANDTRYITVSYDSTEGEGKTQDTIIASMDNSSLSFLPNIFLVSLLAALLSIH